MPPTITPGMVLAGVDPVIEAVAARLEATMPAVLARLEAVYGRPVPPPEVGESDLWRPPGLYARSDRAILEPDDYPAVLVVPQHSDPATVEDTVDGSPVLKVPYRLRAWAFCRYYDATGAGVAACRNRLAVAVLQALLRYPKLGEGMALEPGGWRQSFSDVGVDDDDQSTIAGWWGEFTVSAVESAGVDSLAEAATITPAVHPEAD